MLKSFLIAGTFCASFVLVTYPFMVYVYPIFPSSVAMVALFGLVLVLAITIHTIFESNYQIVRTRLRRLFNR